MKAQRRHELQTNTLAQFLSELPLYLRFHFGKILLGVLILALLILLVRNRMTAGEERAASAARALSDARRMVARIPSFEVGEPDAARRAANRQSSASQIIGLLDDLLTDTKDPDDSALRAEAYIVRGDLYWTLANLPPIPGAATQPALQMPMTPEQYLKQAEDAYQTVLIIYKDRPIAVTTAMFALAAIAENRQQWDAARAQYDAILTLKDLNPMSRELARERLEYLPRYVEPMFTGTVTSQPTMLPETFAAPDRFLVPSNATTQPTTEPSAALGASTQPTTVP